MLAQGGLGKGKGGYGQSYEEHRLAPPPSPVPTAQADTSLPPGTHGPSLKDLLQGREQLSLLNTYQMPAITLPLLQMRPRLREVE